MPQTAAGTIAELAKLLRRSDVRLAVFDVRQPANRGHAGLEESKLFLRRKLDYYAVVEFSSNRSVGSSGVNNVERKSRRLLNAVHDRADWKSSKRVCVAFLGSHWDARDEARRLEQVAGLHVLGGQNVLHLITNRHECDIRCSTAALDDLHDLLDLHFSLAGWTVADPFHPVISTSRFVKKFTFITTQFNLLVLDSAAKSLHDLPAAHRIPAS